jgi:hypothetical protein
MWDSAQPRSGTETTGRPGRVTLNVNLGALHLDALRRRAVTHGRVGSMLETGEADYTVDRSGDH